MDMHIPHALLQVAQEPRPYRSADRPDYFFSEQLSATLRRRPPRPVDPLDAQPAPELQPAKCCARWTAAPNSSAPATGIAPALDGEDTPMRKRSHADRIHGAVPPACPGVFNLGGDLDLFLRLIEARNRAGLVELRHRLHPRSVPQLHAAHELPITTISLVQGDCLGGGFEAALSSDIVVAERHARFGFPEILFNLFPGMGAYSFLDRRVGRRVTEELLSTGKIYSADDMLAMGVIDSGGRQRPGRGRGRGA